MHLSMLTPTTSLMGSGGDSVGVSNLAWLDAPMVQHFKLANDDLIPISYKPFNNTCYVREHASLNLQER